MTVPDISLEDADWLTPHSATPRDGARSATLANANTVLVELRAREA